jgi:hypothetical protein
LHVGDLGLSLQANRRLILSIRSLVTRPSPAETAHEPDSGTVLFSGIMPHLLQVAKQTTLDHFLTGAEGA